MVDTPTYLAGCPMVSIQPSAHLTSPQGQGRTTANTRIDRETLREPADAGNEAALDRLADLADETNDTRELSELLDVRQPVASCASCNGSPTPGTTPTTRWSGC
ncbi:hypothetical protein [Streptomyces cyaneofuscatus]|uniref:hypothetical protein n=1 Tax=Streptomyces cyaneofuscatus TaxID=66883 RepID=UPI0036489508